MQPGYWSASIMAEGLPVRKCASEGTRFREGQNGGRPFGNPSPFIPLLPAAKALYFPLKTCLISGHRQSITLYLFEWVNLPLLKNSGIFCEPARNGGWRQLSSSYSSLADYWSSPKGRPLRHSFTACSKVHHYRAPLTAA